MQRRGRRSSQPRGAKLRSFVKSFNSLKEAIRVFQSLSVFKSLRELFSRSLTKGSSVRVFVQKS